MPDASNELERILALGEQIRAALETGALDQVSGLTQQRAAAVERLRASGRPPQPDSGARVAEALAAQHHALAGALAERQHDVEAALTRLGRLDEARQTYAAAAPQQGGVLHRNLCG